MRCNQSYCRLLLRLSFLSILVGLIQVTGFAQTGSGKASVRGSATAEGNVAVGAVKIVAIPSSRGGAPSGKPIPAIVTNGKYRIDEIDSGTYTMKAFGKYIKRKVMPRVTIEPGNSNVVDISLECTNKRTAVRGRVLDASGAELKNARVLIYLPDLTSVVCKDCFIDEVFSNDRGEIASDGLDSGESYALAVQMTEQSAMNSRMILSASTITLGSEPRTEIELRVGAGPEMTLTATVLSAPLPAVPELKQLQKQSPAPGSEVAADRTTAPPRSIVDGEQLTIKGVVVRRDSDTFTVRDLTGTDTVVRLTDRTSVKTKGGFLRTGTNYGSTQILRGLNLEVEGRGGSGELVAEKVRFNDTDLRTARAVEARATPLEERASTADGRLREVEQNAQKLSGQLDELAAVSNAARGGAKSAQATADAAVAGVNATNERISALDDYRVEEIAAVNFHVGSSVLNTDAKAKLDAIATKALNAKGYVLEITGYADSTGSTAHNRALSQRRADAVIKYLLEVHGIPVRRIVTPYGFGSLDPVADNKTSTGRAENRRVEVKVLINKGLNTPPSVVPPTKPQPPKSPG